VIKLTKEFLLELFINYPVKDIEFSYNQVTIILNQGHEIVLEAEMADYDECRLIVGTYETKRIATGKVELD
jgi:hypothetical protein